ncbi:hypothetical protein V3N99_20110 [Dermatophilaceae bacterium Soc4.6]
MIVRILGEGQLDLGEEHLDELNELDAELSAAVTAGDATRFERDLTRLLDRVQALGRPMPDNDLNVSDLILPGPDSSLAEVTALLGEDGLIPG